MRPYSSVGVAGTRPALATAFPHEASAGEKLRSLLRYAVLAPSGHNMQPWKFHISGETLELFGDCSRALPVTDPQNRELVMSCGAALLNLRVALRNFGYTAITELCPDPATPYLLATLKIVGQAPPGRTDHRLFKAIPERRTNRNAFESRAIPRALLYRWQRAAGYEDAWLHSAETTEERLAVADLVQQGEQELANRREYRDELPRWLRPNQSFNALQRDGVPGYSMGLGDLASTLTGALPLGTMHARRNHSLVTNAPAFFVLGTAEDDVESWMIAGQALSRILLAAQSEGVTASFFLQPIELPHLRARLIQLIGEQGYPQITFRLGYGSRVQPTPRRPVSDVLMPEANHKISTSTSKETASDD
jgi:hypothetical protein